MINKSINTNSSGSKIQYKGNLINNTNSIDYGVNSYNKKESKKITTEIFDFQKVLSLNKPLIESNLDASDYEYIKKNIHNILYNDKYLYGAYGGNQGRPLNRYLEGKGENYEKIIKKWFPDINDEEILDYLNAMNEVGCGYVAISNYIIESYADNPEQFEKDFGFPIATKSADGEIFLTTNLLFIDLYCYANKKNLVISNSNKNFALFLPIEALLDWLNNRNKVGYSHPGSSERNSGTFTSDRNNILNSNRYDHLNLELKTIKEFYGSYDKNTDYFSIVKSHIENGEVIELSATDYTLWYADENNNILKDYEPTIFKDESHAMTITGITNDNKYIISSWGYKYILDPTTLDENYGLNYIGGSDNE